MNARKAMRWTAVGLALAATAALAPSALADGSGDHRPAHVDVLSPRADASTGIGGKDWVLDLKVRYPDGLPTAGWTGPQLTGPAGHNNVPPAAGTFSTGHDDKLPGVVVLLSTTTAGRPGFSGPGTNLANLFNVTAIAEQGRRGATIADTWLVGGAFFGTATDSVLTVAVVKDLNGNGVLDDAPDVVPDANGDGKVDAADLKALGVASNVETVRFRLA
ncbi:hypothetical protein [Yinghuangia seranimata]|uniref:hypothetical protein n=1 Tax=Yinghuangia seranimata TaxID=408067 RepID=UPI00248AE7E8|nr:hypothetical protein [Yinghuangia seranimata]MDI2128243.1 hypothetical protein [Yinghuangia seranimata]